MRWKVPNAVTDFYDFYFSNPDVMYEETFHFIATKELNLVETLAHQIGDERPKRINKFKLKSTITINQNSI